MIRAMGSNGAKRLRAGGPYIPAKGLYVFAIIPQPFFKGVAFGESIFSPVVASVSDNSTRYGNPVGGHLPVMGKYNEVRIDEGEADVYEACIDGNNDPAQPSLDFSQEANSQYIPLFGGGIA